MTIETRRWGSTIHYEGTVVLVNCAVCSILHGIPDDLEVRGVAEAKKGRFFYIYCPLGHQWYYTPPQDSLDKELARTKRQLEMEIRTRESLDEEAVANRRQLSAAKGQVTRIKNRIANGICPCCNRSFSNVARHMKNQHPDFTAPTNG